MEDARRSTRQPGRDGRAFRGLALVFVLTFVNLAGVLVTATAVGGVAPWSRWQFIGLFGVVEAASGLANVVSPNVWRLPIAEQQTSRSTDVRLAASSVLIPHWGGLARSAAGGVCIAVAAWHEGLGAASLGLVALLPALAWAIVALSALLARAGVARPEVDVVQFVVRWRGREKELTPISLTASVLQFLLAIVTLPAAKVLAPSMLYQPELAPSAGTLFSAAAVSIVLAALVYVAWWGRLETVAPADQQREAEEQA